MAASGKVMALAYLALTGVLAVVIITTLLAVGVKPRTVFSPGFALRSWCEHAGYHAPNALGVVSTVLVYWAAILVIRFAVARAMRGRA